VDAERCPHGRGDRASSGGGHGARPHPSRLTRVARTIAVAALVALTAGACGGSPPNAPAAGGTFADATCADLASWSSAVQRAFRALQAVEQFDPTQSASAPPPLAALSTALSDADRATQRLSDGIRGRPAPEVTNGEQVKTTILSSLKELRDLGKQARTSVDAYTVESATPEQATKLKSDLQGVADSVQNTLAQLTPLIANNDQLRSALENSATCRTAASNLTSS